MGKTFVLQNTAYHIIPGRQKWMGRGGMTPVLIPCSRSAHDQNVLARRPQWDQHGCHSGRGKAQASLEGSFGRMRVARYAQLEIHQAYLVWPLSLVSHVPHVSRQRNYARSKGQPWLLL